MNSFFIGYVLAIVSILTSAYISKFFRNKKKEEREILVEIAGLEAKKSFAKSDVAWGAYDEQRLGEAKEKLRQLTENTHHTQTKVTSAGEVI